MRLTWVLRFDGKMIGVHKEREALPDTFKGLFVKGVCKGRLPVGSIVEDLPEGIDDHGVATVMDVVTVIPDAVDADDIHLVFDRPRLEQRFPGVDTTLGPVGDIDQEVVFGFFRSRTRAQTRGARLVRRGTGLAAPDRET